MNNFLKCTKWVMVLFSVSLLLASANQDFDDVLVKVTTDNRGHVHVYGPNFHCFTPPMSQKTPRAASSLTSPASQAECDSVWRNVGFRCTVLMLA